VKEPPATLAQARVAILGLGLMGGSLALALGGKAAALVGVDPDPQVIELALDEKIIERGSCRLEEILPEADLVILAAPVRAILDLLARLPELHPGCPVVLDIGSTKQQITRAMADLPERFEVLGGHPMCGSEKPGLANASADLFHNAPFALTPLPRTTPRARRLAEELVLAVGARPLVVPAETHDAWTAATSHMPYLLACALAACTPPAAAPLVGPGFRSTSRVAGTSPRVMLDILSTNTPQVLEALSRFRQELTRLEELLGGEDWPALAGALEQAARRRGELSEAAL
jgi:prephenate dehydrogenase